ncbi:YlqF/YawG family GTPase [Thermanaerovibrio acidaminovorans]|uniref:Ribosome biogenesis GTPase A n=1 Tax=Thermanaerovibrio acidaminovorans (strain ATCC 49978 / DSM 6589 / Su883) TaxID=525903 RepID=D1B6E4_THEAS|nr:GTPase [Thermanaerovibrio acidaminovorans]ACZ19585.1 GTP-binding protein HSR1-related protein [Thermanaerovibrio acidaminovorans DSM 6589]
MGRTVWYPGHMAKGRRQLEGLLDALDLWIEVRDARAPHLTSSPFMEAVKGLNRWVVLSRADLADPAVTDLWVKHLRSKGVPCWALDARKQAPSAMMRQIRSLAPAHREVRLAVVGVPNVGKSALLNHMIGRSSAKVGSMPGVTRGVSWFRGDGIMIVDSPGVLDPRSGALVHRRLAWLNAVKGAVVSSPVDLAADCLDCLSRLGLLRDIMSHWGVEVEDRPCHEILGAVAERLGKRLKGGVLDLDGAAKAFLEAFASGRLGRVSLEVPGRPLVP